MELRRRAAPASKPASQALRALAVPGLVAALLAPGEAAAYIDPGTGSLILQGLIAGFAAAAVVLRGYWYRIKAFFRGEKKPEPAAPAPGPGQPRDPE